MGKTSFKKLTTLLRYYILMSTTTAGSGHPSSALSAVDVMGLLYAKYYRFDMERPDNITNDRVIFSKGHASPLMYALYTAFGAISEKELMTMRTFDSPLEGHPMPRFPLTEAATGSLGQGLSVGVGQALAIHTHCNTEISDVISIPHSEREIPNEISPHGNRRNDMENIKDMNRLPHVYALLGDGEVAEGSVWEAINTASKYNVHNLTAIVDVNRLGQSEETMHGHDMTVYRKKFESFGCGVIVVDGHEYGEIDAAFQKVLDYRDGPTVILAKTTKGKGVSFLEDVEGHHGVPLTKEELDKALKELGKVEKTVWKIEKPEVTLSQTASYSSTNPPNRRGMKKFSTSSNNKDHPDYRLQTTDYKRGASVATRKAFGSAIKRLGSMYYDMVVIDGDVQNSTYTSLFHEEFPDRFFQMYIAEQQMVGGAIGFSKLGLVPWVVTFACFLTRAHDQIRMAAFSESTIKLCGSHAGVSIGQDGPSQMGLDDIAMMRAIPGSTVFYPADAIATERLVDEMMQIDGISYIRTTRPATPILYKKDEKFPIGGSKVHAPGVSSQKSEVSRDSHAELGSASINDEKKILKRVQDDMKVTPQATIIAAGITLYEALDAQKELEKQGILVQVIDCYSIKPIDEQTIKSMAKKSTHIVVVEDHYEEGGLGEAVMNVLKDCKDARLYHLCVRKTPRSGTTKELLAHEEIDKDAIVKLIKSIA